MDFEEAHKRFIAVHCSLRTGERLHRLSEGHQHAEMTFLQNVWWPSFGHFNFLHPEYQIRDYKDGYRYLDFAYLQPNFRIAIEVDGYESHCGNISKKKFSDQCHRQNSLVIDGWNVIRFAFQDVRHRPRLCQQTIQQLFGRLIGDGTHTASTTVQEREVNRLAIRSDKPVTPRSVCETLQVGDKSARMILHALIDKQWLEPVSGNKRIHSYKLNPIRRNVRL